MKVKSIVVLISILFSILSPLSLHLAFANGQATIEGLDVCHAGSLALSPGHDVPFENEPLYQPSLPSPNDSSEMVDALLRVLIMTYQDEDPPKP